MTLMEREIALKAFREGFAIGASGKAGANRRHVVEAATHAHWRAGFQAGRLALDFGTSSYDPGGAA